MSDAHPTSRWILWAIVVALLLWGTILGLGAALQVGGDRPADWRKLGIVLGASVLFLGWWGTALWLRTRRQARRAASDEPPPRDSPGD